MRDELSRRLLLPSENLYLTRDDIFTYNYEIIILDYPHNIFTLVYYSELDNGSSAFNPRRARVKSIKNKMLVLLILHGLTINEPFTDSSSPLITSRIRY